MRTAFALALLLAQATFTTRTTAVIVPVTVTDAAGVGVPALRVEQFRLFEDGRERPITSFEYGQSAVTLGLLVDRSASMRLKLAPVAGAIESFARSARTSDELFVLHFNQVVTRPTFPDGPFTNDPVALRAALDGIRPFGTTALNDAIVDGLDQLRVGTMAKRALIVLSDGTDNASRSTLDHVRARVRAVGALVYTIALSSEPDDRRSNRELGRLATESGARAFAPRTPSGVSAALASIADDLRQQYVLGFMPDADTGDGVRSLRVAVTAPGRGPLTVRSRSSYVMPPRPRP